MIENCIHCKQDFNFSDAQLEKLETALANLGPGKNLRMNCPHCGLAFNLQADGLPASGKKKDQQGVDVETQMQVSGISKGQGIPLPPDTKWLASGQFEKRGVVEDVPLALILVDTPAMKTTIAETFVSESYRPVFAKTVEKAMESMRFVQYAAIVFHPEIEGKDVDQSAFHAYMQKMEMDRRRNIFYTLIGPSFHTLYDLEALSNSANLVVNDNDVPHFATILKKAKQDYENLFGPMIETLKEYGK